PEGRPRALGERLGARAGPTHRPSRGDCRGIHAAGRADGTAELPAGIPRRRGRARTPRGGTLQARRPRASGNAAARSGGGTRWTVAPGARRPAKEGTRTGPLAREAWSPVVGTG